MIPIVEPFALSFLYDLALLVTVCVTAWVALDIAMDAARRRILACVAVLAGAGVAWSGGELLLQGASSPAEILAARRLLFAGVCLLPPAWVWTAWTAAWPQARAEGLRVFAALLVPGLAAYACLYLAPVGVFVDWTAQPPVRGPVFYAHTVWSWLLIVVGAAGMLRAARSGPQRRPGLELTVAAATFVPLLLNAAYLVFGRAGLDPTPVALGGSALLFRVLVLDLTWGAWHPPIARSEVVAQMHDAVLVADASGRVVDWNAAAGSLLGVPSLEGAPIEELTARARARHGRAVDVRTFPLALRGRRFGRAAVIADRTAMREAELRLEMGTRLEAVGYLASGAAHEINNPLTYVAANLALLDPLVGALARGVEHERLPEPLRPLATEAELLVADAREGTERIQRIVEKLTRFAGAEREGLEPPREVDLRAAVEKAASMACFGKRRVPIPIEAPEDLPPARASESDVLHVVFHLLLNAMQMGGEDVPIAIAIEVRDGRLAVRVADEGPGIRERDLPHLFEPFYTTRRPSPSLGLGLSLCWELARRHGGLVEAANRPEGGAVFTLWLPAVPGPALPPDAGRAWIARGARAGKAVA